MKSTIVIERLASSLGRRDEAPNIELAQEIAQTKNLAAVKVLVENLRSKKAIQNDCIKVLYEIGALQPALISPYLSTFIELLDTKNNRLQWGLLTALQCLATEEAAKIYQALPQILVAAQKGSVISKDNAFYILVALSQDTQYRDNIFPILVEFITLSPPNQLPMYAEKSLPIIEPEQAQAMIATLQSRLADLEKESKRKRVEKVIKKLQKHSQ